MDANQQIDQYINEQPEWQQSNLNMFRELVHEVVPDVEEQWKWSVPVFAKDGKQKVAMSSFKEHTKFNFFGGSKLEDKNGLFNSGLDSKQHRSINLKQGEQIDTGKLKQLLEEAFSV